jgi:hypothetical protein
MPSELHACAIAGIARSDGAAAMRFSLQEKSAMDSFTATRHVHASAATRKVKIVEDTMLQGTATIDGRECVVTFAGSAVQGHVKGAHEAGPTRQGHIAPNEETPAQTQHVNSRY